MKFLFEFFPIILFFTVYKFLGIFYATVVAIAASIFQIVFLRLRKRKIEPAMWISLVVIVFFGGATLVFRNELFIKWKPTILYWVFASLIFVSNLIYDRRIMKKLLQKQISMPEKIWKKLDMWWAGFFSILGLLNMFVAFRFSTDIWVNFKLFGVMGLMFLFVILQSYIISPHLDKSSQ